MKFCFSLIIFLFLTLASFAQTHKTENIIIVTLDGMRWQEVFGGSDSILINSEKYTPDTADLKAKFWSSDSSEKRKKLFPFLSSTIAEQGQLYGNRNYGNFINNANLYWFSYPGYNEIFTGYPDTAVNSNDKIENKNTNVLEFINKQQGYEGKVAAFSTWDVFPYILNAKRSRLFINSGVDSLRLGSPQFNILNQTQFLTAKPLDVRPDVLTYMAGKEYLKEYQPKVLYIAFDETDDYAHRGDYEQYLTSAHAEDNMIKDLWTMVQSIPQYKDKTTLIVTCDHGRGNAIKDQWRDHGQKIKDAGQIWLAVLGPDTEASGEQKQPAQLYQRQIATTIASLLNFTFKPEHEVGQPIEGIYKR